MANTENTSSPDCAICNGAGFLHPLIKGKPDYSKTITCSCIEEELKERRRQVLLKSCELPPQADNMTFKKYKQYPELKDAYKSALEMANEPGETRWLSFIGLNAVGKTHLAIAICKQWIAAGVPARYSLTSLLLDELREGFKVDNGDFERKFEYYCNVPLLVLDDYGIEHKTSWVQERLETIIDSRYMNNLSLIITSNLTLDDMSPRVRSRLLRHPKGTVVAIIAPEYSMR